MEETLWNGVRLCHGAAGFPLSTDSVLLANFVRLPKHAAVADLGSGCGTLGLLLCASNPDCHVTGIELEEHAHQMAMENIRRSALIERMESLHGDVREIRRLLPAGAFSCVVSNPPYFAAGSGRQSMLRSAARSEATLPLTALCEAAAYLLPEGGRFALVHRPERLCDLFCALRGSGIEPKRIRFVRHDITSAVCLVLLEGRRGGKPGISYEPDLIEFTTDGTESEDYRAAYHRGD